MTSRIRIRVGTTEVEFEGSEEFMGTEFPRLIELLNSVALRENDIDEEALEVLPSLDDPKKQKLEMTTNTIAAKLKVKTAQELVLAACACLSIVKGVDTYKRQDILDEMKSATNFYNQNHRKGLTYTLLALIKNGKLLEKAPDKYALEARTKDELEAKLNGT